ncbi:unnamed protein product [Cylicostephanus goldi]|uniref:Uncharacterized protein n=1 Tax=Cylicostephanus goldi TaxID=71465 RepID=A0A3P6USU7_CYLGO|nr:unnamed protein product [Cylicostephanus goldi]
MQRELCRKDDVETWVYQQVELTVGRVPWREVQDINQYENYQKYKVVEHTCYRALVKVGEYKKRCRQPPGLYELFAAPCPREYVEILQLVDSLKYYDQPNYAQIYAVSDCNQIFYYERHSSSIFSVLHDMYRYALV